MEKQVVLLLVDALTLATLVVLLVSEQWLIFLKLAKRGSSSVSSFYFFFQARGLQSGPD